MQDNEGSDGEEANREEGPLKKNPVPSRGNGGSRCNGVASYA